MPSLLAVAHCSKVDTSKFVWVGSSMQQLNVQRDGNMSDIYVHPAISSWKTTRQWIWRVRKTVSSKGLEACIEESN